jgi:hypothetical protein
LIDGYSGYRYHHTLPGKGGWFDQDPHILDGYRALDKVVEWYKQNEKKRDNLPTLEDVFSKRRAHWKGE